MELDRELHLNIARAAHNDILFAVMSHLAEGFKDRLWVNLKEKNWSIPGRPQKSLEEHTEIVNAIKNKDSKSASERMFDHLTAVEKALLAE